MAADRWAVGWVDQPFSLRGPPPAPGWLEPGPGRFYADPFVVEHAGQRYLFVEEYVQARERGHVAVAVGEGSGWGAVQPVLSRPHHLSYPCLVYSQGEWFCIPEQHQAGCVALYRARRFPCEWGQESVLLADLPGVDPTVFFHQDLWWMLLGRQDDNARNHLFLYWSTSLTGPWQAHPGNPVQVTDRRSRCAGLPFQHGPSLLRPAQNRTRTYGGSLIFYEIVRLNTKEYEERQVGAWEPRPGWPFPDGLHHLSCLPGLTVFDAKRFVEAL